MGSELGSPVADAGKKIDGGHISKIIIYLPQIVIKVC
jgi:hypothetical protein